MEIHQIKSGAGFMEIYVIPSLELLENLVKINWSKIAKGAVSVRKRKVELLEAELKAPVANARMCLNPEKSSARESERAIIDLRASRPGFGNNRFGCFVGYGEICPTAVLKRPSDMFERCGQLR
jgi:hypothetical protein